MQNILALALTAKLPISHRHDHAKLTFSLVSTERAENEHCEMINVSASPAKWFKLPKIKWLIT